MSIKFTANEIRYIALFENMTGAMVKDCVSKVQRAVDKGIEIVELSDDPIQFIKNLLSPAEVQGVKVLQKESGEKIATVTADNTNKRIAIGKNGVNIERAKLIAKRQHNINNIILK